MANYYHSVIRTGHRQTLCIWAWVWFSCKMLIPLKIRNKQFKWTDDFLSQGKLWRTKYKGGGSGHTGINSGLVWQFPDQDTLVFSGFQVEEQLIKSWGDFVKPSVLLKLSCAASGSTFSCYGLFWFQQIPGKGLNWIAYISHDSSYISYTDSVKGLFTISRENVQEHIMSANERPKTWGCGSVSWCSRHTVKGHQCEPIQKLSSLTTRIGCSFHGERNQKQ